MNATLLVAAADANPLGFLDQFGVEWQMLVSQGLSFAIVAAALYWFVFKPVIRVSEQRQQAIQKGLDDAAEAEKRLSESREESARLLANAAREAAETLRKARDDAKSELEKAAREASERAAEIRARSDEQIARDKAKMKEELKSELSELVAAAAQAVAGEVLTPEQKGKLAELAAQKLREGK